MVLTIIPEIFYIRLIFSILCRALFNLHFTVKLIPLCATRLSACCIVPEGWESDSSGRAEGGGRGPDLVQYFLALVWQSNS